MNISKSNIDLDIQLYPRHSDQQAKTMVKEWSRRVLLNQKLDQRMAKEYFTREPVVEGSKSLGSVKTRGINKISKTEDKREAVDKFAQYVQMVNT